MVSTAAVCYRSQSIQERSPCGVPDSSSSTGRILIVALDGEAAALSGLLREAGHAVHVARGGEEARIAVATRAPDLVILDTSGQEAAAIELLAALSQIREDALLPVLVLGAGEDIPRLRLRAFGAGAADFIPLPCDEEELLARLRVQLSQRHARERLARALRQRQELFNLIAHDIKNPLTSILFAREMLALPDCKPERVGRYLQIIEESTREALDYVRDYLESQSPDGHGRSAQERSTSLGDTLRWLAARYELQLEARGLRLRTGMSEPDACVAIDRQLLRHVGENLIGNALKYAHTGGEVELVGRPGRPGHWQLVVQDRGPGVPAEFQPLLFKPFQRGSGHGTTDGVSNGLGLALTRQIVVGAGGRLWYEDREGGGARFIVELQSSGCPEPATPD